MSEEFDPIALLNAGNYRTYITSIAKKLGSVNAAIMLSELIQRHDYHKEKKELLTFIKYEGEWFFFTIDKCYERTALSKEEQNTAIKILEKYGLFKKKSIGLPAKRHFSFCRDKILEFINSSNNLSRKRESQQLDSGIPANYKAGIPPANKEQYKNPKEDNNSESVVVSPFLDELDIPKSEKIKICKSFDESKSKMLVKRVKDWIARESDLIAVRTIIKNWDTWKTKETKEDKQEKVQEKEDDRQDFIKKQKERAERVLSGMSDKYIIGNDGISFMKTTEYFDNYHGKVVKEEIKEYIPFDSVKMDEFLDRISVDI